MSYDQTHAIEETVRLHSMASEGCPRLVLEVPTASRLTRNELMELSRSCAPSVIARVGALLTGLRVVFPAPTGVHSVSSIRDIHMVPRRLPSPWVDLTLH